MLSSLLQAIDYPSIFLLPILMMADYLLTLEGARQSARVHRKHFVVPTYELNPVWRRSVDEARWFNPRHLGVVLFVTSMMLLADVLGDADPVLEVGLGSAFGVSTLILGRHFSNLLVFRFLNRHPDQISGQVSMTHWLNLKTSQFIYLGFIPLLIAVVLAAPNPTTLGMILGALLFVGVHSLWARKARKAEISA